MSVSHSPFPNLAVKGGGVDFVLTTHLTPVFSSTILFGLGMFYVRHFFWRDEEEYNF